MSRTVMVTGAGGFVGSHVVEELLARTSWHVIGTDSFRHNGEVDRLVDARGAHGDRVTLLTHDLTVPFVPRQLSRLEQVSCVINVASRCHVGESIDDPAGYLANNLHVALNVLELVRWLRDARLVHVSTDEVYGPELPLTDTDHRPSSPYAASKAIQEDCVHAYARTYAVDATVVTSANMFGERQSALAFVPRVVRALLRDERIDVHLHDGRPGTRHYSYVRNVAATIVDEARRLRGSRRDVCRVALPGQATLDNRTLVDTIADVVGVRPRINLVDAAVVRPGYDPGYPRLSGSWQPRVSFEDGLARTVDWHVRDLAERDVP